MLHLRKHTIRFRQSNGRRGSVIVLVVAVLALLAVMGTVYIVSSRSERGSANAAAVSENLDLAQQAVNEQVLQMIGENVYDANGTLAGSAFNNAGASYFGTKIARRHTMPEYKWAPSGILDYNSNARDESWLVSNLYRPGYEYNFNFYNFIDMTLPQSTQHVNVGPGPGYDIPTVFDPLTGQFDIPIFQPGTLAPIPYGRPNYPLAPFSWGSQTLPLLPIPPFVPTTGLFRVVNDQMPSIAVPNPVNPPASGVSNLFTAADDAFVQLLPFSEANGTRYRFGLRIIDTSRMANLNVGSAYDFPATAAPNGSYPALATSRPDLMNGTYYGGYLLATPRIFDTTNTTLGAPLDLPGSLNVAGGLLGNIGNPGRLGFYDPTSDPSIGGSTPTAEFIFQQLNFRQEYAFPYRSSPWDQKNVAPFDLSDELALRAYGVHGTSAQIRASAVTPSLSVWPNTLGNTKNPPSTIYGDNFHRANYTTYSYSRDFRSFFAPPFAYTLTRQPTPPSGSPQHDAILPPYPARIAAMPDIAIYAHLSQYKTPNLGYGTEVVLSDPNDMTADALVTSAINIAAAMEVQTPSGAVYTHDEARAFAVNYLTFRWPHWVDTGHGLSLPFGPSFIDNQGICLRGDGYYRNYGDPNIAGSSDLTSQLPSAVSPTKVYLGYAAQPFINEIAVSIHYDNMLATPAYVETDWAIELYNPYDQDLALDDYKLVVNGVDIDFSTKTMTIPKRGFFVLTKNAGNLDMGLAAGANKASALGDFSVSPTLKSATSVLLMRKYLGRSDLPTDLAVTPPAPTKWGTIDQYVVTNIGIFPGADAGDEVDFLARANNTSSYYTRFVAAVHDVAHAEVKQNAASGGVMTLGAANASTNALASLPLYDRTIDGMATYGFNPRRPLDNINEFNKIMRVSHQIDPNGTPPGAPTGFTIATQLANLGAGADTANTDIPLEANVHFDFKSVPQMYSFGNGPTDNNTGEPNYPPNNSFGPNPKYKQGDNRAARLLENLAIVDRVSDNTINIDAANRGLAKIRIPGQINVNTASAEVLASIPVLGANPKLIGYILAYRWRTTTDDVRIPSIAPTGGDPGFDCRTVSGADFSPGTSNDFPGYGIRSIGELMVPVSMYAGVKPTLYDRDQLWGAMAASLTVRSDTFAVYAYLEGVRQNPRYAGKFDNQYDWYNTSTGLNGAVTDDANDSLHPLLRVARRRWVAIIDRSQSNYSVGNPNFTKPRIVAQKDLPR